MAGENFSVEGDLRNIRENIATMAAAGPGAGGATEAKQDTIIGHVDGIETSLTTLLGYVDGLEGFSDGIEGLITSTNTLLTTQAGYVDGLETLLTTQAGYLDGLETLIGTTNTKLNGGLPAALAANGGLKIEGVASGVAVPVSGTFWQATQPVSGTVAATQSGTWNVTNISGTISLPTGAATETSLAAAAASLSVMDDWDESDRLKANLIVGQAGITAGAGAVAANTPRITHASDDPLVAKLPASLGTKTAATSLSTTPASLEYEAVAASATDQALGATGAAGDFLSHIIIQPATTAAGTVTVKDNSTVIYTFTTGTLADLRPIIVPFNLISSGGSWKITTGANVAVLAVGDFT